jgi:hypothetical protein
MKNAGALIALTFVGFMIVLAISIGNRLNEQAVALLAGATCGVGIALPIGIAIGLFVYSQRPRDQTAAPQPPIVIMSPPPAPPMSGYPSLPPFYPNPPRRSFNIIGEDGPDENEK